MTCDPFAGKPAPHLLAAPRFRPTVQTVLGTTVEEASSINECTRLDSDTGMQVSVLVAGDCEGPRELRPTQGTLAVNAGVARPRKEGFGD